VLTIQDGGEYGVPQPYARTGNMDAAMVEQSAAPVAAPPPPPSAPFSAGITTQEVRVRVDFALRSK